MYFILYVFPCVRLAWARYDLMKPFSVGKHRVPSVLAYGEGHRYVRGKEGKAFPDSDR